MSRYFFSEGAQERYNQARFDAIRALGKIAGEQNCQFVVVSGDVFQSNQVDRKTVTRAIEALKQVPVPVWILPGNHDPLNEASVFFSNTFSQGKPAHVNVIRDVTPIEIGEDVEIVGAPWLSKRVVMNPFYEAIKSLEPMKKKARIILAHGIVDVFTPKKDDPGVIAQDSLKLIIDERKASFIALGDRHSRTMIGASERIWYPGTPEVTDFGEDGSGYVQVVELSGHEVDVTPFIVGQWRFIERDSININNANDIEELRKILDGLDQKERTALRLGLVGSITLTQQATLTQMLDTQSDVFASFQIENDQLLVVPDDEDFSDLGFSGFAEATVKRLRDMVPAKGNGIDAAQDALMLLKRLGDHIA